MEKTINFHNKQEQAFFNPTQFGAAIAGVQSGKTFMGAYWTVKKMTEFPKNDGLILAPTYKILQQSTLKKFFGEFPQYKRFYKESKGVIELPTGGSIFVRSADNPFGIEGMTLHYAWMDEAGQMKAMIWTVIRSRVSFTGGQVLITTTPYNMGWLYQEFYVPWKENRDDDLAVFTWKSTENPHFPKAFYEKERMRLSDKEFAKRYMGEFRKMEGLVYDDFTTSHIIPPIKPEDLKEVDMGADWGYTHPTAGIVIGKDKRGRYIIADEYYKTEQVNSEIWEAFKGLQEKWNIKRFYPDPEDAEKIEEMRRNNFYVREVNKDVQNGIGKVRQLLRERQLLVCRNCINTIDEFETYHYPENDKSKKEAPVKENDDAMDAIRYKIYTSEPKYQERDFIQKEIIRRQKEQRSKKSNQFR